MQKHEFYGRPTDASRVKQDIVAKYFGAWKNVLKTWPHAPRLGYVDLYSGPGVYADGSPSTPLLILQQALEDNYLRKKLVTIFNDGNSQIAAELRANIARLPGIQQLVNEPQVYEHAVSEKVVALVHAIPTLLFADPWGYKGLSIKLIEGFLGIGGSDCIFFFNYNRINAGLGYEGFDEPLDAVFGHIRAEALRSKVRGLTPVQRERIVIGEMQAALKELGARCALPFRFISATADRTSHHLLFASKHPKGCNIMKELMRQHSSDMTQGFGSFEFTGATVTSEQPMLPGMGPLDDLKAALLRQFAQKTISFDDLILQHEHVTATERNFKDAVLQLESEGAVTVIIPGRERRRLKGEWTLPNDSIIKFG